MIAQFLSDLNTVLAICGAFFAIDQMLNKARKRNVAQWLRKALDRTTPISPDERPTRITAAVLATFLPSSRRESIRLVGVGLLAMMAIGVLAYFTQDGWADGLHLVLQRQGGYILLALSLLAVVLAFLFGSLTGPLLLPIVQYSKSRWAFPAFLFCSFALLSTAFVVSKALIVAPATLIVARQSPSIIPLSLTVESPSPSVIASDQKVQVNLTRRMSEEERTLVQTLIITKFSKSRPMPDRINFFYFNNDSIQLAQANNVAALFHTHSGSLSLGAVCGKTAGSLVREMLDISLPNIYTMGDAVISCNGAGTVVHDVSIVLYANDLVEFSLGFGLVFGATAQGLREMTTQGVRDGIGISSEWYISRRLVKDAASIEKMHHIREFFDRRKFENSLHNVASVTAITRAFYPMQFWIPLMAAALFLSCAVLIGVSKAKRRYDVSWLADSVDRAPLSVIAVLTLIIGTAFAFLRAILGLWL